MHRENPVLDVIGVRPRAPIGMAGCNLTVIQRYHHLSFPSPCKRGVGVREYTVPRPESRFAGRRVGFKGPSFMIDSITTFRSYTGQSADDGRPNPIRGNTKAIIHLRDFFVDGVRPRAPSFNHSPARM